MIIMINYQMLDSLAGNPRKIGKICLEVALTLFHISFTFQLKNYKITTKSNVKCVSC